jgi:hypothetical protein
MLNRRRVGIGITNGLSGLALVPLIVTRVENHQAGETYAGIKVHGGRMNEQQMRVVDQSV